MIRKVAERVRNGIRKLAPATRNDISRLERNIADLRADNNELRADNLRIAALHDAVVTKLAELANESSSE